MNVNSFNERLRTRRMGLGMQGKELAERVGVSSAYITQLEKGLRTPSGKLLNRLADILKVPVDWLWLGKTGVVKKTDISYQSKGGIPVEGTYKCHECPKKDEQIKSLLETLTVQNGKISELTEDLALAKATIRKLVGMDKREKKGL